MLQDERANTGFNFECLYFKGSKNDEKAPVVRQYAQRGNLWRVAQRKDNLALGAEGHEQRRLGDGHQCGTRH